MKLSDSYDILHSKEVDDYYHSYDIKSHRTKKIYNIEIETIGEKIVIQPTHRAVPTFSSTYYLELKELSDILHLMQKRVEEEDPKYRLQLVTTDIEIEMRGDLDPYLPSSDSTYKDICVWNRKKYNSHNDWKVTKSFLYYFWCFWVLISWAEISWLTNISFLFGAFYTILGLKQRAQLLFVSYLDWKQIKKRWHT